MSHVVTLVGRPNVGKSTLYNRLTLSRDALVADYHGLTRDRQIGFYKGNKYKFSVIDTPGIVSRAKDIEQYAILQTLEGIKEADIIFFIINAQEALTAQDYDIAQQLRKQQKKIYVLLNKIDGVNIDTLDPDIYKFGWQVFPISSLKVRGIEKMLSQIFPEHENHTNSTLLAEQNKGIEHEDSLENRTIKIAIIGRPNLGKSSLINSLLGYERVLIYDMPGTTRDSISLPYTYRGNKFLLIDTAGIRKRKKSTDVIEKFSIQKSLEAVETSDVGLLLIDAVDGVVEQDLNLIHLLTTSNKSLLIVVNKIDKLNASEQQKLNDELVYRLRFISFVKIVYISAKYKKGLGSLHRHIMSAYNSAISKWSTNKLTRILLDAISSHQPPIIAGRRVKMRYAHQGGNLPLTIVIHGSQVDKLPQNYKTYLLNCFYTQLSITGAPIKLVLKNTYNPYVAN
jgi:GTPase